MQEVWILRLDVDIDRDFYVLVNFYNNNIESDKRHTFPELNNFLNKIADISIKKIWEVNLTYFLILSRKQKVVILFSKISAPKIREILENFDLWDLWRIRSTKTKRFIFRQCHFSGVIKRRLDYFFFSIIFQQFVKDTDTLACFFFWLFTSSSLSYG